jgi:hypothetical protein
MYFIQGLCTRRSYEERKGKGCPSGNHIYMVVTRPLTLVVLSRGIEQYL